MSLKQQQLALYTLLMNRNFRRSFFRKKKNSINKFQMTDEEKQTLLAIDYKALEKTSYETIQRMDHLWPISDFILSSFYEDPYEPYYQFACSPIIEERVHQPLKKCLYKYFTKKKLPAKYFYDVLRFEYLSWMKEQSLIKKRHEKIHVSRNTNNHQKMKLNKETTISAFRYPVFFIIKYIKRYNKLPRYVRPRKTWVLHGLNGKKIQKREISSTEKEVFNYCCVARSRSSLIKKFSSEREGQTNINQIISSMIRRQELVIRCN